MIDQVNMNKSFIECRTVAIEIAPLCTVVIWGYTGVTPLHRGTIPIATVLHSATEIETKKPVSHRRLRKIFGKNL